MSVMASPTIYALASAHGRGGVAVIRVSGSAALTSLVALTTLSAQDIKPRYVYFTSIQDNVSRETIDEGLVLYFKAPNSFTGEDVVEYHLHGGRAITQKMLQTLSNFKDHRMAEPGEFTRRAFENNKLDLTQAEAVVDLVDAETDLQRQQALLQLDGQLSGVYDQWRQSVIKLLAFAEAHLDFPDEEHVPDTLPASVQKEITILKTSIESHLDDNRRGERLRDGIAVVIIGAPNAGKSSFLNAVSQRDVAIVSDIAGTTRDVLEVPLDLGGYPVRLIDTAGLRPEALDGSDQSKIEEEGIRRAYQQAKDADLKILMFSAEEGSLNQHTLGLGDKNSLFVLNKTDTRPDVSFCDLIAESMDPADRPQDDSIVEISIKANHGMDKLLKALTEKIADNYAFQAGQPSLTRERHRTALKDCITSLQAAEQEEIWELAAQNLRDAAQALGRITGKIDVEQLLDVIFGEFCIGK
jgi:tRNA modification GTPase